MPGAFFCSMAAARAREIYDRDAKERRYEGKTESVQANLPEQDKGQSRDQAGKAIGVSGR